mmetsp:Transcript_3160/g.4279  ORF Transcript_3160/g.4279 Transcript_3160/m.4279 type:complete len:141 (-) Transcript_3160:387-809(-)|eukprot:CAMPEP_0206458530 /NCGR_PEP_ID=MMETSP0324_2-20121206/23625_1 /ASSEMBLY_ACC=CAM_ASM_000836 /TAXON_ID=2866 /ORGANISM="Crypthecodinium cohnii, Strain Seligo" /LENGTH=140 /DNA_ID=CAMNT_0053929887 /DNA_START=118 /DNA_END=540 /DNA_ORIENTATION=-
MGSAATGRVESSEVPPTTTSSSSTSTLPTNESDAVDLPEGFGTRRLPNLWTVGAVIALPSCAFVLVEIWLVVIRRQPGNIPGIIRGRLSMSSSFNEDMSIAKGASEHMTAFKHNPVKIREFSEESSKVKLRQRKRFPTHF